MSQIQNIEVQILTDILANLTTIPDKVEIERIADEQGVLLTVKVDANDMGIVIGRSGSMATALKTILKAVGKANDLNVRITFLEPENSNKPPRQEYQQRTDDSQYQNSFSTSDKDISNIMPDIKFVDADLEDLVIN
jgi:predicted RNA-binding protein YlqC (UPF0109 family)